MTTLWSLKSPAGKSLAALALWGLLAFTLLLPAAGAQTAATPPPPAAAPPGQGKILADITTALQQQIQELSEHLARHQIDLKTTQEESKALGVSISTHKAALSLDKISLEQAKELQKYYDGLAQQKAKAIATLNADLEKYAKIQAELREATSKSEVETAPSGKTPAKTAARRGWEKPNQQYLKLAAAAIAKLEELQKVIQALVEVLQQEQTSLEDFALTLQKFAEEKFKTQLLERQKPSDLPTLIREALTESLSLPGRLYDWTREKIQSGAAADLINSHRNRLLGLFFFLLLLLYAMALLHRATRNVRRQLAAGAATFSLKLVLALVNALAANFYLLAIIIWLALSFQVMQVLEHPAAKMLLGGLGAVTSLRLAKRLLRSIFAPGQPDQGIITLDASTARYYCRYGFWSFSFLAGGYYLSWCLKLAGQQLAGFHLAIPIYLILMIFWFAWLLRQPYLENLLTGAGLPPDSWLAGMIRGLRLLMLLWLAVIIIIELLGYQNLAIYLAESTLLTGVWLAGGWLVHQLGRDLNNFLASSHGYLEDRFGVRAETLEAVHVFFAQAFKFVIYLITAAGILLSWGMDTAGLLKILALLSQGPSLGHITLSPLAIFLAVFSIWAARRLSSFTRLILQTRIYQRRDWDMGIRHTISNTVHYTLMTLGIIVALGFLGINFSNLAIIAGGLGVGIGFGLQNIVNNFLSGLILLFERPIKVGDLLIIDGQWGTVRDIRVRSTVFETVEHSVLIIPNSDLLSNKILNWTFYGRNPIRLTLKVGVAYDSDVHEVTRIIDQVCRKNPRVVAEPPPQVSFTAYGDSSLDFTIWVFIRTPKDRIPATHELNAAIFDAFNRHRIEFPYPQMDLHIRSVTPNFSHLALPPEKEEVE